VPRERDVAKPVGAVHPRGISATERLREALLDRQLQPGSRVKEEQLSRMFGVSRTPIRAALQSLAGEGLLDYAPHRGYTVRSFPLAEIVDAYEMRALAEGLAARLSAERGLSSADRTRMIEILAKGDQILKSSSRLQLRRAAYAEINNIFHAIIRNAAGSRIVTDVIRLCQRIPQTAARNVMAFDLEDVRLRHDDHHQIYEAIICREPKEAESLMRAHVSRVKTAMIRAFAELDKDSSSSLAS
jgi:GntR family transcriptional regulator, vanillate catabolism transcriptional regulator